MAYCQIKHIHCKFFKRIFKEELVLVKLKNLQLHEMEDLSIF